MPAGRAGWPQIWVPVFWAALLFSFVMAILPQPPGLPGGDKFWHMVAFLVLGGLGAAAYRARPLWRIGIALSCYGALIELAQAIPVLGRHADFRDWLADTVAAAAALCVVATIRRAKERSAA